METGIKTIDFKINGKFINYKDILLFKGSVFIDYIENGEIKRIEIKDIYHSRYDYLNKYGIILF